MNPFLQFEQLPQYDKLTPEHARSAIEQAIREAEEAVEKLEHQATPTWDGCMAPQIALVEPLQYAWGILSHMHNAMNTPEWRSVHDALQPHVVSFFSALGQNPSLFRHMSDLRNSPEWEKLDMPRKRLLESSLREAIHAGANCPPEQQTELTSLRERNASDSSRFTNHVLDATKSVVLTLQTAPDIEGLPPSLLQAASETAIRNGATGSTPEDGPWMITLEMTLYLPFMQYSHRRDLRETLHRAACTRASSGQHDNTPLLSAILQRRKRIAHILGYGSYAELALSARMAPDVAAVEHLTERIREAAYPAALSEHATLEQFARKNGQTTPLAAWDIAYWAEQLRKQCFSFNDEELRPYLSLPRVLDALFQIANRLFGIVIAPADGLAPVWHPDVRLFTVSESDGTLLAHLYLDPYSRPETKRGGAWMDLVLSRQRRSDGSIRLPAALMVCNQSRPTANRPSLMTLMEATTLFHEFGHALQHILTTVELAPVAGIQNVEWDAVELPSQFMENWFFHRPLLQAMARHIDTDAPLPADKIEQILASRWFRAGSNALRQIFFGKLDLALHHDYDPDGPLTPNDLKSQLAPRYTILPLLPEDRFLCSFSHIFAGGYAAGYYSYKWAEVLAADAFAAFEEVGLDHPGPLTETGRRFRDTVLAAGGSQHPMEVFRAFRGRDPDPDALLRQSGLLTSHVSTSTP